MKRKTGIYILLHMFLLLYSTGGIVSKLAASKPFLSLGFCLLYALEILILGFYALGWQQFIKRIPLTVAYANKAVIVVWGCVWGVLLFREQLSINKVAGVLLVLAGVVLYSISEHKEETPHE